MPCECVKLTAFVDVQQQVLYFAVVAWDAGFGGHVVDYGTFPQQNRDYFTAADARPSLSAAFPGVAESAAIYAGLGQVCELVVGRAFPREDSTDLVKVERCLIDANWGRSTDTVYQFIRRSAHSALLLPSHGRGIGPAKAPMSVWAVKPGDQTGWNYRVQSGTGANRGRHVTYDANRWKSMVAERLRTPAPLPWAARRCGVKDRPRCGITCAGYVARKEFPMTATIASARNLSGVLGVYRQRGKWRAGFCYAGKLRWLPGSFATTCRSVCGPGKGKGPTPPMPYRVL